MAEQFLDRVDVTRRCMGQSRRRMTRFARGNHFHLRGRAELVKAISNELWIKATTVGIQEYDPVGIGDAIDELLRLEGF